MKTRTTLITASMTALLAAAGSAFAAGGGSASDNTGGATGGGAAANGVYPAPTQGVEQGVPATGNTQGAYSTKHHRKPMRHHAKKPVNDTTNIPGADASSDTKGQ